MTQSLRRSQYITTYGPGAILEGPDGPRMITALEESTLFDSRRPADFEVTEQRLSQALLNNARIVRIPSNAEAGVPDSHSLYHTSPFPSWALCVTHGILYHKTQSNNRACPRCPALASDAEAWRTVRRQAIRFVRACPAGHLDDVDWKGIITHKKNHCNPAYLRWQGAGGALRYIQIECPDCGGSINLGEAYSREWSCTGRHPERDRSGLPPQRPGCVGKSSIIQRGAANLRISEIVTSLTIPPRATPLHRILEMYAIRVALTTAPRINSKGDLLALLTGLINNHLISPAVRVEVERYPEQEILTALSDTTPDGAQSTPKSLRSEEFAALCHAAESGYPPQPPVTPGSPPQFEVIRSEVRTISGQGGYTLRVTPVNRLRVVMVQTGYRRLDPLNQPVKCVFTDHELNQWYPGVELFGEGIFIDLAPDQTLDLQGSEAVAWYNAYTTPGTSGQQFFLDEPDHLHPVFIWWHTLSHRLINALAVDSGYSSAAVRERVYVLVNEQDPWHARGGLLLYTSQPGGDGTLGGMVALVSQFERVLRAALWNLETCSNDPLCGEETFGPDKYNGAACYACALVSETSCEHRNMRLDRNLLLANLP